MKSIEIMEERVPEVRAAVLSWYDANRRDLPWRAPTGVTPDPYRVWLAEVMLQQTRVETVRPYYERWLNRFPSVERLADAEAEEVLKAWEGLGYYSRARNFHAAVREVARRYDGEVPGDPDAFRSLPGVGAYTAGAVMSIAFGRAEPVVDGNVRRVFSRLLDDPAPTPKRLWALAGKLVQGERPGDLNQAIMELGATVCRPRNPRCDTCPLSPTCGARHAGTQSLRPARRPQRLVPTERHGVAAVTWGERLLLVQRPATGRLASLWEFPGVEARSGEETGDAARRAVAEGAGLKVRVGETVGTVEHRFSHVRVLYDVYRAVLHPCQPPAGGGALRHIWTSPAGLDRFALPRAQHRIARLLQNEAPPTDPGTRR